MLITFILFLSFAVSFILKSDRSVHYSRTNLLAVFYTLMFGYTTLFMTYLGKGVGLYGGLFESGLMTQVFHMFILIICTVILLMSGFYPRKKLVFNPLTIFSVIFSKVKQYITILNKKSEQFNLVEYSLMIIFAVTGALLLLSSSDYASIYLCIELQSFSFYIISSMYRNSEFSTSSALTYFLLGGLSSCFILLGIALIYSNSGLTNINGTYTIVSELEANPSLSKLGINEYLFYSFLLMCIGFLFKISAAPFHWWSPDVYDGVPTIVTTLIAILGKIAILVIFLMLMHYSSNVLSTYTSLTLSSFFSLIIGATLGLTQMRLKRLLAYSTISHIGFILMALIVNNIEAEKTFIFYIYQYLFTNLNAFLIIIAIGITFYLHASNGLENNKLVEKNNSPIQYTTQLKGYFMINPTLAICLTISILSFLGLPPLVGFFAKQSVLTVALEDHKTLLTIIAVLASIVAAVYYLIILRNIYFDEPQKNKSYYVNFISLSNIFSITVGLLTLSLALFILFANEIINLCELLSMLTFGDVIEFACENEKEFHALVNQHTDSIEREYNVRPNTRNLTLGQLPEVLQSRLKSLQSDIFEYASKRVPGLKEAGFFKNFDNPEAWKTSNVEATLDAIEESRPSVEQEAAYNAAHPSTSKSTAKPTPKKYIY